MMKPDQLFAKWKAKTKKLVYFQRLHPLCFSLVYADCPFISNLVLLLKIGNKKKPDDQ